MPGFGEGFLNGLSTGTAMRNAREERRTKKLANEKSERAAKREIDVDNIRAEAGAIDLDAPAGKVEIAESLPEKPKMLDIESGGEAEATTEAVNMGPKSKVVGSIDRPSGLKSVLDTYKRALASGDEQATSDVARMVQISAVGALKEYDKTGDPAKLQSVASDMGLDLKTDDKGQVINPWSGDPVVKEDKERFRLQVLQSLVDPVAAMKEWGSAGDRATERDQKERTVTDAENKTKVGEKQVENAYELGLERNRIDEKQLGVLQAHYEAQTAAATTAATGKGGWGKEAFGVAMTNATNDVDAMFGQGDKAIEGSPVADPAYWDNLDASPVEAQFQARAFASEILADHGPQGTGQALAGEAAVYGAKMLAGDPNAPGTFVQQDGGVFLQLPDDRLLPASRNMAMQIKGIKMAREAAATKGNADRVAKAKQGVVDLRAQRTRGMQPGGGNYQ